MQKIQLFILCFFLASSAFAADKKNVRQKEALDKPPVSQGSANDAPVEKRVDWSLAPYPGKDGYLPKGYQGADPGKLLELFKSKLAAVQKGELETPEDFAQRKADVDAVLAPIKTSDLYAFWKPDILVWYDAISRYFVFRSKDNETFCDEISPQWNACKIATVENSQSSYPEKFPQGMATVKRTKVTDFSLAIPQSNNLFRSPAFVYDFTRMGFYYYVTTLPDDAKKLKANKIGMLFVGSIAGAEIIAGKGNVSPPTFDDPTDINMQEEAIPFNLKKIVFYVVETGKILDVMNIQP